MYTLVDPQGRTFGPVDITTLQSWAREGRVLPDSTIVEVSSGKQVLARDIADLGSHFVPPPAVHSATWQQAFLYDKIAAIAVGLVGLAFLIGGVNSIGQPMFPPDAKAAAYLIVLVYTAGIALSGWGMLLGRRFGFVIAISILGLNSLSWIVLLGVLSSGSGMGGGLGSVSLWSALMLLLVLGLFTYSLLRLTSSFGPDAKK